MTGYVEAAEELRPNEGQWAAYNSTGHCVVVAGPGSGKTKVLTLKMARLLADDVQPPRGVACLTYNNECVRELRRRLDRLGVGDTRNAYVGTVHSFCLRHVLGPFGALAGWSSESLRVASESDRQRLADEAMSSLRMHGDAGQMLFDIDRLRKEGIDRTADAGWDESNDLTRLCLAYERRLADERLLDFEEMVHRALILVEGHAWVRRALVARFPVLVVDEYQDLGRALHRLVQRLCFDAGARLFAVGDPDQSIYAFAGAHPELLQEVADRLDVETIALRLNYRSGHRIVRASQAALGSERNYQATTGEPGSLSIWKRPGSIAGQVRSLVSEILPGLVTRYKPGKVVVLFPTWREGDDLEAALKSAGHEYVRLGRNSAYPRTPVTRHVEDLARWCAGGWREGDPKLSRLLRQWVRFQGLLDPGLERIEKLKLVRFIFEHRDSDDRALAWLQEFDRDVLGRDDCRRRLVDSGDMDSLDEMFEATRPGNKLEDFSVRNLAGQAGSDQHLNLLTFHSSKGSEFDAVVLVGADEGTIPRHDSGAAQQAEARRLFYVGISRARREVHICCSPPDGSRYHQGPSRFVVDVANELDIDL